MFAAFLNTLVAKSTFLRATSDLWVLVLLMLLAGLGIYLMNVIDRFKRRWDYYKALPSECETLKAERDELALKVRKCYDEIDNLKDYIKTSK